MLRNYIEVRMQFRAEDFNFQITGAGAPFVWGHGLMGSMELEDSLGLINLGRIGKCSRLVRYDARGHGRTAGAYQPEYFRWSHFGSDMLKIMDHLRIDRFVAGGQSMGCVTALYAALAEPQRINRLVLVNPPNAWEMSHRQASLFELMARLVEEKGLDPLIEMMQESVPISAWQYKFKPELKPFFEKSLQSLDPMVLAAVLRGAVLSDMPPRDQIRKLNIPALILAWSDDPVHPLETGEELHRLLPDSTLVTAGTMAEVEQWTDRICEFVSQG